MWDMKNFKDPEHLERRISSLKEDTVAKAARKLWQKLESKQSDSKRTGS